MKKWAVGLGLILIFVGFVSLASYNSPSSEIASELAGEKDPDKLANWEYAGNFSEGDIILVVMRQNIFWSEGAMAWDIGPSSIPTKWVDINITDPQNGISAYELQYTYRQEDIGRSMKIYNFTILSFGEGINETQKVRQTGATFTAGIAKLSGTYVGNITMVDPDPKGYRENNYPPAYFALFRGYPIMTYPLQYLLFAGIATPLLGIVFLVFGLTRKPPRKRARQDEKAT
jgi:hypothetical protein